MVLGALPTAGLNSTVLKSFAKKHSLKFIFRNTEKILKNILKRKELISKHKHHKLLNPNKI